MACPRFFPWFDHNSKISVLPAPVGAWTTTSCPSRNALTACCCHRSGTLTWLREGSSANGDAKVDTKRRGSNDSCGDFYQALAPASGRKSLKCPEHTRSEPLGNQISTLAFSLLAFPLGDMGFDL